MKTAKITAQYALAGKIAIQFEIDITDHHAREILDSIGSVFNGDKWSDGNVTRVEKDKLSLTRKAKDDLNQQTIDFPEERPTVLQGEFVVIEHEEKKMLEHDPDSYPESYTVFDKDFECPACGETIPAGEPLVLDEEYYQTKQMITYTCTECAGEYPDEEEGAE